MAAILYQLIGTITHWFLTNPNAGSFRAERKSSDFPVYNSALIHAQADRERRSHDKELEKKRTDKQKRVRDKPIGKNVFIVYKSENPAINYSFSLRTIVFASCESALKLRIHHRL